MSAPRSLVSKLYRLLSRSLLRLLMILLWAICSILSLIILASGYNLSWMWVAAGGKGEINVVASLAFVSFVVWVNWWIIFRLPSKVLPAFKSLKSSAEREQHTDETSLREQPDYADIIRDSINLDDGRVFKQKSVTSPKSND